MKEHAEQLLTEEARKCGFAYGRYFCFEEDCAGPVAKRELLDKGIMKAPVNEYYKEGEYSEIINGCIKRWNPEYWKAREQRLQKEQKAKQKKSRSREER